jgi:hypothetical protein
VRQDRDGSNSVWYQGKSIGLVLILGGRPIGAFVNIEQEELAKSSLKQKTTILTADPLNVI